MVRCPAALHWDYIVDWSPMGCQTGFYLTVLNHDNIDEIMDVVALTMQDYPYKLGLAALAAHHI
jgi:S-ribosylhomocysteine lyase LuxS involved in autoinducer biosynthesis